MKNLKKALENHQKELNPEIPDPIIREGQFNPQKSSSRTRERKRDSISTEIYVKRVKSNESSANSAEPAKFSKDILRRYCREEPAIRRVVNASARLADMLTPEDKVKAKAVIADALGANLQRYDVETRHLDITPDHKTRLAAATLLFAYAEGLPVKREVVLTGGFKSADEVVALLQESPEARRAMEALSGLGLRLEDAGGAIEVGPLEAGGVQNPGV